MMVMMKRIAGEPLPQLPVPANDVVPVVAVDPQPIPKDFKAAFASWLAGFQKISDDYYAKLNYQNPPAFSAKWGPKYVKVVGGGSVRAFVDKNNGDVLKPASWKAPAKHARGNVFDKWNGLKFMGPFGPAYLK